MASLMMMAVGAAVNALAFSGGSYVFKKLEGGAHNKAMEKLTKDRDEWNQERTERIDFVNQKLKEEGYAEKNFESVEAAMQEYYYLTDKELSPDLLSMPPEPTNYQSYLTDEDQANLQKGELIFISGALLAGGFLTYNFI